MRLKLLPPERGQRAGLSGLGRGAVALMPRPLKKFDIRFWYLSIRINDRDFTTLFDPGRQHHHG